MPAMFTGKSRVARRAILPALVLATVGMLVAASSSFGQAAVEQYIPDVPPSLQHHGASGGGGGGGSGSASSSPSNASGGSAGELRQLRWQRRRWQRSDSEEGSRRRGRRLVELLGPGGRRHEHRWGRVEHRLPAHHVRVQRDRDLPGRASRVRAPAETTATPRFPLAPSMPVRAPTRSDRLRLPNLEGLARRHTREP